MAYVRYYRTSLQTVALLPMLSVQLESAQRLEDNIATLEEWHQQNVGVGPYAPWTLKEDSMPFDVATVEAVDDGMLLFSSLTQHEIWTRHMTQLRESYQRLRDVAGNLFTRPADYLAEVYGQAVKRAGASILPLQSVVFSGTEKEIRETEMRCFAWIERCVRLIKNQDDRAPTVAEQPTRKDATTPIGLSTVDTVTERKDETTPIQSPTVDEAAEHDAAPIESPVHFLTAAEAAAIATKSIESAFGTLDAEINRRIDDAAKKGLYTLTLDFIGDISYPMRMAMKKAYTDRGYYYSTTTSDGVAVPILCWTLS